MSKAPKKPDAKKSKDVKGKTVSAEKQQNTTYFEIVPGKFNENDWNNLLDVDESQEFIWELLDECIENANKVIYSNYLENQTIPFTINEAKKAILHLIDWQFLDDDTDDDLTENFVQDKEPEACMIDSWAQGYVQTIVLDSTDYEKDITEEVNEQKSSRSFLEELTHTPFQEEHVTELTPEGSVPTGQVLLEANINTPVKVHQAKSVSERKSLSKKFSEPISLTHTYPTSSVKRGPSSFSYDMKEKAPINYKIKQIDMDAKRIEESIVKAPNACQSLLKTLLTRPVGQREVELDQFGDITSIAKLDFDKTHTVGIKTRFSINDNSKAEAALELKSRRSKIDREDRRQSSTNYDNFKRNKHKNSQNRKPKISEITQEENDIILDPVPGVVFTMLNSVRVGPKKALVPNKQQTLYEKSEIFLQPVKPLERSDTLTRMSLDEILENTHEISSLKKTSNFKKPMPPISQRC